ncbi:MAG: WecB/TagA/CpsF family glycosyltransferase, partial [Lachnospiraceae bacterium]|nr:WecB/TagA/CpsF family glycosyltransferase [Lachnospiraceae bacterium]
MSELQYCEILKTNINVTNMADTLDYLDSHLDALRDSYICVANVHTTVMAYEDKSYRKIQNSAAMALPDGAPLSVYSRRVGFRQAQRVTGPDLMTELFLRAPQNGYRHFFYGSTPQTLEAMRVALRRDYPGVVIAGMYAPPFRPLTQEEDREVT